MSTSERVVHTDNLQSWANAQIRNRRYIERDDETINMCGKVIIYRAMTKAGKVMGTFFNYVDTPVYTGGSYFDTTARS